MEKFNVAKFEKNKINGEYIFTLSNGDIVTQLENLNRQEYMEEIKESKTAYSKVRVYYMKSANLKVSGSKFHLTPIGVWTYYEDDGSVKKHTDWEEGYKFTIEDLVLKMEKMGVDILHNDRDNDVQRIDDDHPYYIVMYPVPNHPYEFYSHVFDGVNGKEIEKTSSVVRH